MARPESSLVEKCDQTADTAIGQIKSRRYTQAFEGYAWEVLLVGISYDRKNKNKPHSCVIEKIAL